MMINRIPVLSEKKITSKKYIQFWVPVTRMNHHLFEIIVFLWKMSTTVSWQGLRSWSKAPIVILPFGALKMSSPLPILTCQPLFRLKIRYLLLIFTHDLKISTHRISLSWSVSEYLTFKLMFRFFKSSLSSVNFWTCSDLTPGEGSSLVVKWISDKALHCFTKSSHNRRKLMIWKTC